MDRTGPTTQRSSGTSIEGLSRCGDVIHQQNTLATQTDISCFEGPTHIFLPTLPLKGSLRQSGTQTPQSAGCTLDPEGPRERSGEERRLVEPALREPHFMKWNGHHAVEPQASQRREHAAHQVAERAGQIDAGPVLEAADGGRDAPTVEKRRSDGGQGAVAARHHRLGGDGHGGARRTEDGAKGDERVAGGASLRRDQPGEHVERGAEHPRPSAGLLDHCVRGHSSAVTAKRTWSSQRSAILR